MQAMKNQPKLLPTRLKQLKNHNPIRQLKVQTKSVQVFHGQFSRCREIPCIALAGEWLRDTGFDCGKQVVIIPEQGQLVIKLL